MPRIAEFKLQAATPPGRSAGWQLVERAVGLVRRGSLAAADLVCPPVCQLCSQDIGPDKEVHVCAACRAGLGARRALCNACAMPLPHPALPGSGPCPACRTARFRFSRVQALGLYQGPLRDAVLRMKRVQGETLTLTMGRLLAERVLDVGAPANGAAAADAGRPRLGGSSGMAGTPAAPQQHPNDSQMTAVGSCRPALETGAMAKDLPDLIAPAPMHWIRRLERGTNPPEVLTETMAQALSVPALIDLLRCRRTTRKQGTLLPDQRRRNVRHAFSVSAGYDITGAHVLLVDDVMTTGATADELSRVLRQAGAGRVSVAVVARGTG